MTLERRDQSVFGEVTRREFLGVSGAITGATMFTKPALSSGLSVAIIDDATESARVHSIALQLEEHAVKTSIIALDSASDRTVGRMPDDRQGWRRFESIPLVSLLDPSIHGIVVLASGVRRIDAIQLALRLQKPIYFERLSAVDILTIDNQRVVERPTIQAGFVHRSCANLQRTLEQLRHSAGAMIEGSGYCLSVGGFPDRERERALTELDSLRRLLDVGSPRRISVLPATSRTAAGRFARNVRLTAEFAAPVQQRLDFTITLEDESPETTGRNREPIVVSVGAMVRGSRGSALTEGFGVNADPPSLHGDASRAHLRNWLEAMRIDAPQSLNSPLYDVRETWRLWNCILDCVNTGRPIDVYA